MMMEEQFISKLLYCYFSPCLSNLRSNLANYKNTYFAELTKCQTKSNYVIKSWGGQFGKTELKIGIGWFGMLGQFRGHENLVLVIT